MSGCSFTQDEHAVAARLGYADWPKRYALPPGSGPAGETCGSCGWADHGGRFTGHCALVRVRHRISAGAPACRRWIEAVMR